MKMGVPWILEVIKSSQGNLEAKKPRVYWPRVAAFVLKCQNIGLVRLLAFDTVYIMSLQNVHRQPCAHPAG